jgi:hypothetical protein
MKYIALECHKHIILDSGEIVFLEKIYTEDLL